MIKSLIGINRLFKQQLKRYDGFGRPTENLPSLTFSSNSKQKNILMNTSKKEAPPGVPNNKKQPHQPISQKFNRIPLEWVYIRLL